MLVDAYHVSSLVDRLPNEGLKVLCCDISGENLYVGTADGLILTFLFKEKNSENDASHPSASFRPDQSLYECVLVGSNTISAERKPISSLTVCRGLQMMIVQIEDRLAFIRIPSLKVDRMTETFQELLKGVGCICLVDLSIPSYHFEPNEVGLELLVSKKRTVLNLNVSRKGIRVAEQHRLPSRPRAVARRGNVACIALKDSYILLNIRTGLTRDLFKFDPRSTIPYIKALCKQDGGDLINDTSEFLVVMTTDGVSLGVFVSSTGESMRQPVHFATAPLSIGFDYPFTASILKPQPNELASIAIHNICDGSMEQSIILPNTHKQVYDREGRIIILGATRMDMLTRISVLQRALQMIQNGYVSEGIVLARSSVVSGHMGLCERTLITNEQYMSVLRQAAYTSLSLSRFGPAMDFFFESKTDPNEVIALFGLDMAQSSQSETFPTQTPTSTLGSLEASDRVNSVCMVNDIVKGDAGQLRQARMQMISYLERVRQTISVDFHKISSSSNASVSGDDIDCMLYTSKEKHADRACTLESSSTTTTPTESSSTSTTPTTLSSTPTTCNDPPKRVLTLTNTATNIDTALLQLYLLTGSDKLIPFVSGDMNGRKSYVLAEDKSEARSVNGCVGVLSEDTKPHRHSREWCMVPVAEGEKYLLRDSRYHALALFYRTVSLPVKALNTWMRLENKETFDIAYPGLQPMTDYLSSIDNPTIVYKYTRWLKQNNPLVAASVYITQSRRHLASITNHFSPKEILAEVLNMSGTIRTGLRANTNVSTSASVGTADKLDSENAIPVSMSTSTSVSIPSSTSTSIPTCSFTPSVITLLVLEDFVIEQKCIGERQAQRLAEQYLGAIRILVRPPTGTLKTSSSAIAGTVGTTREEYVANGSVKVKVVGRIVEDDGLGASIACADALHAYDQDHRLDASVKDSTTHDCPNTVEIGTVTNDPVYDTTRHVIGVGGRDMNTHKALTGPSKQPVSASRSLGNENRETMKRLFLALLTIYLSPSKTTQDLYKKNALALLNQHGSMFTSTTVISILPVDWSIASLLPFLQSSVKRSQAQTRASKVQRGLTETLHHSTTHQLKSQMQCTGVVVHKVATCYVCGTAFGGSGDVVWVPMRKKCVHVRCLPSISRREKYDH
eukprot:CFRG2522T1